MRDEVCGPTCPPCEALSCSQQGLDWGNENNPCTCPSLGLLCGQARTPQPEGPAKTLQLSGSQSQSIGFLQADLLKHLNVCSEQCVDSLSLYRYLILHFPTVSLRRTLSKCKSR